MFTALIVEDDANDLRVATALLKELGCEKVDATTTVAAALLYFDEVVEEKRPAPDLLVLDLAFGYESGFEVLRRWRSDLRLKPIHVVIWTQMGDREQELCHLFGLKHVVSKWGSHEELKTAIRSAMGLSPERSESNV